MHNIHDIKNQFIVKIHLYLTCNVKLGIQSTKFKVINQHKNDMHHAQSLEKDFYHGTPNSFYHVFTCKTNILLTLGSCAITIITFNLCMLRSRFDTFAMVVNFIDEVGCHNMSQWDYLKH